MASMYDTLPQQRYSANGPMPLSPAARQTFWHLDGFPHYQQASATPDPTSQSGLPPGFNQMLNTLNGGGRATGGPNTAGSVATDRGSWGAGSPYGFADYSGASGGLGGAQGAGTAGAADPPSMIGGLFGKGSGAAGAGSGVAGAGDAAMASAATDAGFSFADLLPLLAAA